MENEFGFPRVIFVFQEDVRTGQEAFSSLWPAASAIADPSLHLYAEFGIGRARPAQIVGRGVWRAGLRALRGGNLPRFPSADPQIMPGAFIVQDGFVHWSHAYRDIGDQIELPEIERWTAMVDLAPTPVAGACAQC